METKATSKGQITIPSVIRKQLGIKDGTYMAWCKIALTK